ncbi:glycoside hydrolase family 88 protein [Ceratobasidium sp. AG-Ba]|nr:glycoside hydrolase family 88 protein [Ceratobasidium sp. AG-Ba]
MSTEDVGLVKARLKEAAQKRQALLELDSPSLSVFTASSIPGSPASRGSNETLEALVPLQNAAKVALAGGQLKDIMKITTDIVSSKADGSLALMKDGSAADPASNGVAVLVANWTESQGPDFASAASDQLTWLLQHVPRSSKGAISHRNNAVQFWSDFIYMVPPFLAYYGATTSNKSLIAESYKQIKLYREVLLDDSGLWQHIRQGSFEDKGLWSTGNGWAAMGMMRVAATIKAAGYMSDFEDEFKDLSDWTAGIFDAMWPLLTEENLFYNYADNPKTFLDGASSALMAASVYRAAVLFDNTKHIASAEKVYKAIGGPDTLSPVASSSSTVESSTSTAESDVPTSTPTSRRRSHSRRATHHRVPLGVLHHSNNKRASDHIDSEGWLTPVVDPHSFHKLGKESAEGQAFVIMMYAARNDYLSKKGSGLNLKVGGTGSPVANVVGVGVVAGSPAGAGTSGGGAGGLNGAINVGGVSSNGTSGSGSGYSSANGAISGSSVGLATGALAGLINLILVLLV